MRELRGDVCFLKPLFFLTIFPSRKKGSNRVDSQTDVDDNSEGDHNDLDDDKNFDGDDDDGNDENYDGDDDDYDDKTTSESSVKIARKQGNQRNLIRDFFIRCPPRLRGKEMKSRGGKRYPFFS